MHCLLQLTLAGSDTSHLLLSHCYDHMSQKTSTDHHMLWCHNLS